MRLITKQDIENVLKTMGYSATAYGLSDGSEEAEETICVAEAQVERAIEEATGGEVDPCLAKDIIRHPREWDDGDWSEGALEWKRAQIKRTLENL